MRRHAIRLFAVLAMLVSLVTVTSQNNKAYAEGVPELRFPATSVGGPYGSMITGWSNSVSLGCHSDGPGLKAYNMVGTLTMSTSTSQYIDGVQNCIWEPVVDKNRVHYGVPWGHIQGSTAEFDHGHGPNLLAYTAGGVLKWKYPTSCATSSTDGPERGPKVAVGANGNIYVTKLVDGSVRLVELKPDLEPPRTSPTEVSAVPIPGGCNVKLHAYRDGIAVATQTQGFHYYSYGGAFLRTLPGDFTISKINTEGRLFSLNQDGDRVIAHDPFRDTATWQYELVPGTDERSLHPLPDGGVAVYVEEPVYEGGMPVIPAQTKLKILILNWAGQLEKEYVLPYKDSSGNSYTDTLIEVDVNGKLVITRPITLMVSTSSGVKPSRAISLQIVEAYSGTVVFSHLMTGNLTKTGGPSGYAIDQRPKPADGSLYLVAYCTSNCANGANPRLFSIKVPTLRWDYPRGAVLTAKDPDPSVTAPYLALGDSFSSGEGVEPFAAGTDEPNFNTCHRSNSAYPKLIAGSSAKIPSLGNGGFRACSGATTDNIWDVAQWNESIQLNRYPNTTTQLVTISIGGNDIGFADFGEKCFFDECHIGSEAYNTALNKINNELPAKLETTYKKILESTKSSQAKVYVVGYPHVIADLQPGDPWAQDCFYMYREGSWSDAQGAREIVTKLNQTIAQVIADVRDDNSDNLRLNYIKADGDESPFKDHEVCGDDGSWFQNVDEGVFNKEYAFHPNVVGQMEYAKLVANQINSDL